MEEWKGGKVYGFGDSSGGIVVGLDIESDILWYVMVIFYFSS